MAISPAGRTVILATPDGAHEVVDLLLVTSLKVRSESREAEPKAG
ncbi:MAG: hypothetical protein ACE15C_05035 [Phycisphaerae bacterium]